ncbi:MAG: protoheme IX farnesyltransferase [Nitrospinae bacterium]|nr:protoheme IX farnesyltransferase [Nitrospinota bacterium]
MYMKALALNKIDSFRFILLEYFGVAKPGIIGLVVVAALTGIYFGNKGTLPDWSLITFTLLGLSFSTAGSCMLNNYFDRDIDRLMDRTSKRALAQGIVPEKNVLYTGLIFVIASFLIHYFYVNPLTAYVTLSAAFGYVVLYGMIMKRRTPWANQVGGIAGALPPVIGYVAVTGYFDATAFILFLIVAVWQQPHALSLALKYREDYLKASIPVIPVAKGIHGTKIRIVIYTGLLFYVAALPFLYGMAGEFYFMSSFILNAFYFGYAVKFYFSQQKWNMPLFFFSIVYLVLLFGALVVDMT